MEEETLKSVFHVGSFSPTRQEKLFLTRLSSSSSSEPERTTENLLLSAGVGNV